MSHISLESEIKEVIIKAKALINKIEITANVFRSENKIETLKSYINDLETNVQNSINPISFWIKEFSKEYALIQGVRK